MKTLQMVFNMNGEKELVCRLPNPRSDLKRTEVEQAMQSLIDSKVFKIGNKVPLAIKEINLITTEKAELL